MILLLLNMLFSTLVNGQNDTLKINRELSNEIIQMFKEDGEIRDKVMATISPEGEIDSILEQSGIDIDTRNTNRMKEIVETYGWPTTSMVGKEAASDAIFLLIHADRDIDFQNKCLSLMQIAAGKQDIDLANALHDSLWNGLSAANSSEYVDEGLDNGGYGVTVYGHLVSALTEAYYITNDWEADQYLAGTDTVVCKNNGTDYSVKTNARITAEVNALYQGLENYFNASGSDGGTGGNDCPPGKQRQNKC